MYRLHVTLGVECAVYMLMCCNAKCSDVSCGGVCARYIVMFCGDVNVQVTFWLWWWWDCRSHDVLWWWWELQVTWRCFMMMLRLRVTCWCFVLWWWWNCRSHDMCNFFTVSVSTLYFFSSNIFWQWFKLIFQKKEIKSKFMFCSLIRYFC